MDIVIRLLQLGPQSCFRPRKLLHVYRVYNEDQSFNNFENDTMKLSVNEAKLTDLWARNCASIQQSLTLKLVLWPEKFPSLARNGALVAYSVYVSGQNDQQTENLSKQMVILAPSLSR